jgi:hypothetical protein
MFLSTCGRSGRVLLRPCHHLRLLTSSPVGQYILPVSKWSVKTLNLLEESDQGLICIETVSRLADLACVDLNHVGDSTDNMPTKEQICADVNIILKCAQSLKVKGTMYYNYVCAVLLIIAFLKYCSGLSIG